MPKRLSSARISTGRDSKQDYRTPGDFMEAVVARFGPVTFDLAAHAANTQSPNYFAPCTGPEGPLPRDPKAFAIDALDHPWAHLSTSRFRREGLRPGGEHGLLWLNCEWCDIPTWAAKSRDESLCEASLCEASLCEKGRREASCCGANILLLTPAAVGAVWFSDLIAPYADTYLLRPRISFIPGEPLNRDCMLSHFVDPRIRSSGRYAVKGAPTAEFRFLEIWNWQTGETVHQWLRRA